MPGPVNKDPKRPGRPSDEAAWADEKKRLLERIGVLESALMLKRTDEEVKLARTRVEALERELAEMERRLSAAIEDASDASGQLAAARRERERAEGEVATVRAQLDRLSQAAKGAETRLHEVEAALTTSLRELQLANGKLEAAERDLRSKGRQPLMPAPELARLTTDFLRSLESQMPGMFLRDGELRLKVAVGKGDAGPAGFHVVTPDAPPELASALQEFVLRFGKTGPETQYP